MEEPMLHNVRPMLLLMVIWLEYGYDFVTVHRHSLGILLASVTKRTELSVVLPPDRYRLVLLAGWIRYFPPIFVNFHLMLVPSAAVVQFAPCTLPDTLHRYFEVLRLFR